VKLKEQIEETLEKPSRELKAGDRQMECRRCFSFEWTHSLEMIQKGGLKKSA